MAFLTQQYLILLYFDTYYGQNISSASHEMYLHLDLYHPWMLYYGTCGQKEQKNVLSVFTSRCSELVPTREELWKYRHTDDLDIELDRIVIP